jgi:hypothetical protein
VLIMAIDYAPIVIAQTANPEDGAHPQAGLGEFFALPLFACAGLMWMSSANHLVSIFVSLETVSITFYILVAYLRRNVGSLEAGVKYLILGALSTGFLVYGFAWLFGVTGSMELPAITEALGKDGINTTAALFAFALILIALAFKLGAAPFHLWIPDVYQGAPTPVTAFLSVGSKAAATLVTLRLVTPFLASAPLVGKITAVLIVVAILTLLVGNLAALPQKNHREVRPALRPCVGEEGRAGGVFEQGNGLVEPIVELIKCAEIVGSRAAERRLRERVAPEGFQVCEGPAPCHGQREEQRDDDRCRKRRVEAPAQRCRSDRRCRRGVEDRRRMIREVIGDE